MAENENEGAERELVDLKTKDDYLLPVVIILGLLAYMVYLLVTGQVSGVSF